MTVNYDALQDAIDRLRLVDLALKNAVSDGALDGRNLDAVVHGVSDALHDLERLAAGESKSEPAEPFSILIKFSDEDQVAFGDAARELEDATAKAREG